MPKPESTSRAELVVQFFARMRHLYGHRWSHYGAAMNDGRLTVSGAQWGHDLAEFPESAVMAAVKRCESEYPDWPPTVPQFKALCLNLPTLAQVLDRRNDYGPTCSAIRARLDWYNLDALPTREMLRMAQRQYEIAMSGINRSGFAIDMLQAQRPEALA